MPDLAAKKAWVSPLDPKREAQAVKALRESMAVLNEDDALLADTIEGETGLFEMIDSLLARRASDLVMIEGTKAVVADLEARTERFKRRIEADRALIEQAMMIAELPKIERPCATLSLSARAPRVEITTEADIPAEFWKAGEPTLDRKALKAALESGRHVAGAVLSNAAPSLTVRVK
jgi:hypothetical protein